MMATVGHALGVLALRQVVDQAQLANCCLKHAKELLALLGVRVWKEGKVQSRRLTGANRGPLVRALN